MKEITLKSKLSPLFYKYVQYRKASRKWCVSYQCHLQSFDLLCYDFYPLETELKQEMINNWCKQKSVENADSNNQRISVINGFINYYNVRYGLKLNQCERLSSVACTYIPYHFELEQIKAFFIKCDSLVPQLNTLRSRAKIINLPAIVRLLYSSGIRTCGARLLTVDQVNLSTGVLNIKNTKGYNQHYIVLHESMRLYLEDFNKKISILYPNRKYFFPNGKMNYYCRGWLQNNFNAIWESCGYPHVNVYDLRHYYAIINIDKLINEPDFNKKFYYLSKSMGHVTLESTKYYYSLSPTLTKDLKKIEEEKFNNIVPGGNKNGKK
jgi:site-specific recombinase XerD